MACPNGYIELNGNCVYAFGNDSGIGPDGTPLPENSGGGFWNWVKENLPGILIGVGTVWQAGQSGGAQDTQTGNPPPAQAQQKMPTWAWFALALAAIAILFLLLRRR